MSLDAGLRRLQPDVERALAGAIDVMGKERRWDGYEMRRGLDDLLALSQGRDACYDSPSVGWAYAGWYHGRRVQDALRMLFAAVTNRTAPLTIVDLGSGTGATLWAAAALTTAARQARVTVPPMSIVAVDASAPMMQVGRRLWDHLRTHPTFSDAVAATPVDWRLRSWTDVGAVDPGGGDTWVVAGHLFDSSDAGRLPDVCRSVATALDAIGAQRFLTSTAGSKHAVASAAAAELAVDGWARQSTGPVETWWLGDLRQVRAIRQGHYAAAGVVDAATLNTPRWSDPFYGLDLARSAHGPRLFEPDVGLPFRLDEAQKGAARPDERMTAILGAAGSGKSWVLVERIVRTAETRPPAGVPHRILVTTFNKRMVQQLSEWLGQRLAASSLPRLVRTGDDNDILWSDPGEQGGTWIRLVNVDKLAHQMVGGWFDLDQRWRERMMLHLQTSGVSARATTDPQRAVLDPAFLLEEARTVIRGRDIASLEEYRRSRSGRRSRLSAEQTQLVWDALTIPGGPKGFPDLRLAWTHELRARHAAGRDAQFTHLFVDECQDMTETDFESFTYLVPDPSRIVVTGDEAQSVKLGSAYHRPRQVPIPQRFRHDATMFRLWQEHRLTGSYRLPVRLCEAIQPIAERIREDRGLDPRDDSDAELPISTKAAVLGRRPIVVAATSAATVLPTVWEELAPQLALVAPQDRMMTEAERLSALPAPPGWNHELGRMFDIKGLERDLVLWDTRAPIPAGEPLLSWIYTILTRSRSMLVIVADPNGTDPRVAEGLALLRRDRLLAWDLDAHQAWDAMTGVV